MFFNLKQKTGSKNHGSHLILARDDRASYDAIAGGGSQDRAGGWVGSWGVVDRFPRRSSQLGSSSMYMLF